jgi:23S rRNA (adenine2030-N6)-methyltransferase
MNYRHDYHAGNFADVVKHAVLTLVLDHMRHKAAAFRVIDTHAGPGVYDLTEARAARTGEWRDGIGRLLGAGAPALPLPLAGPLKRYLDLVKSENPGPEPVRYPGSPRLARAMLRPVDTLVVNELRPEDHERLRRLFARDPRVKVMALDGYVALKALLPPPERRGVVLVDPPFEAPGEFQRMCAGLEEATQRFAQGVFLLWYPIKDLKPVGRFHRGVADLGLTRLLKAELTVRAPRNPELLNGTGLLIHNPPYQLDGTLRALLPPLAERLAQGPGGTGAVAWIVDEDGRRG